MASDDLVAAERCPECGGAIEDAHWGCLRDDAGPVQPYVLPSILRLWLIDQVKRGMAANDLTQVRLSTLAGISEKHASRMLTGAVAGSVDAWDRLLHAANVRQLLRPLPAQPDVAPSPDVDAGGAGDEVYVAAAQAWWAKAEQTDPLTPLEKLNMEIVFDKEMTFDACVARLAGDAYMRAAVDATWDAARTPLLAELAEAHEQVAALENYRQLARETSDGFHAGAVKLIEERDQLRAHILDIDAHATPYGDLPEDPGYVGVYLLSAGALHRALGKIGHTAPKCQAEAQLADMTRDRDRIREDYRAAEKAGNAQLRQLSRERGEAIVRANRAESERDKARAKAVDGGEWVWGTLNSGFFVRNQSEEYARFVAGTPPHPQLARRYLGPVETVGDGTASDG